MADSAVAITAGSGTNIDTRTEATNSNHRQVVVLGDPSTNAGVAPVDATAGLKVDLGADNDVTVTGAALTALQLIDDAVYVDDADWTDSTSKHLLVGGLFQGTPQTITDGDVGPFQVTANGYLIVSVNGTVTVDGSGVTQPVSGTVTANLGATDNAVLDSIDAAVNGTLVVDGSGVTQPISGTVTANLGATDNAVLDAIDSNTDYGAVTGAGTETGALRVTLANDSTGVISVDDNAGSLTVDNADITTIAGAVTGSEMQVDVVAALPAGTNTVGDVGLATRTSGGVGVYYDNDLDETAVVVKAGAGQIYFIHAINLHTAPLYLQLFNVAQGSVTVGTTAPTMQFVIPSQGDANGAGFTIAIPQGIAFGTAITAAASTDSEGNGAPGANVCHVNIGFA